MTLLAVEFPPIEFLIFAVAILLALVGKIVEFAKKVREKSIEAERREGRQFGVDLREAPEPPQLDEAPPVRLELVRRPPRPRREAVLAPVTPARPMRPSRPAAAAQPRRAHPIARMLRRRADAQNAIVLAEILGPPKALRRWR